MSNFTHELVTNTKYIKDGIVYNLDGFEWIDSDNLFIWLTKEGETTSNKLQVKASSFAMNYVRQKEVK
jgi:hypothetical protein